MKKFVVAEIFYENNWYKPVILCDTLDDAQEMCLAFCQAEAYEDFYYASQNWFNPEDMTETEAPDFLSPSYGHYNVMEVPYIA